MASDRTTDYEVGRGKPPRHTRFQKKQSGNPNGRPRGSRNLKSMIDKELAERIVVSENGRRQEISKKQALAKRLVNGALAGDRKFLPYLVEHVEVREAQEERMRPREGPPLTTMTRPQYAREVLKILREIGELDQASGDVEDATLVEHAPSADSEPAPEPPCAWPTPALPPEPPGIVRPR